MRALPFLSLLLLFECSPSTIDTYSVAYDLSRLEELEPWHGHSLASGGEQRFLILAYFTRYDCRTCVDRNLLAVRNYRQANPGRFDLAVIVFDPETPVTAPNPYLSNMRRIGMLDGPILLERVEGATMLGNQLSFSVYDRQHMELRARFIPAKDPDDWPEFAKQLDRLWAHPD